MELTIRCTDEDIEDGADMSMIVRAIADELDVGFTSGMFGDTVWDLKE